MDVFDKFFNETFGLPWQHGDFTASSLDVVSLSKRFDL
jgi:hypothetical protein